MKTILVLEDNGERIEAFQKTAAALQAGLGVKVWQDAPSMINQCEAFFPTTALISLDHDLNPQPGATVDPATGLDVARFLAECRPVCPVIIHTTNVDRAYSMHNELRFADWIAERVGPIGPNWVQTLWRKKALELLSAHPNTWPARLSLDHQERMQRVMLSLDGLSVGDAFGECFFTKHEVIERRLETHDPPPPPWFVTDDTMMALSIARCLRRYGHIEQGALAATFAREYARDPHRGYGGTAHGILRAIGEGTPWAIAAGRVFDGQGSCGNGGAMRAAPVGAYFADDLDKVVSEAKASAEVTHAHPDGQTGAIAVALAAAWVARESDGGTIGDHSLIRFVLERIPQTETYHRLKKALELPLDLSARTAASVLGNGSQVIASDTVPFCLWCVASHPTDYPAALWKAVSGLGDRDTTCAIVGGIVALGAGLRGIPSDWLRAREPLQV
jgi:ADP-ribosylglycohydrolase